MYRYYSRLNQIDEQLGGPRSLLKAAYEVDKLLTVKENSWTNNVIQYSKAMKISSLEISKELYKQKLGEFYKSKINFELSKIREESSGKLLFYSKIYKKFEQQEYLKFHIQKELRKQLTKLRISAHPLAIETGRYSKPKTPHNERCCKFCKDQVEDESHFLLKCPKYNILRQKYGIDNESNEDSLSFIINLLNPSSSRKLKTICLFLMEAFEDGGITRLLLMFHEPVVYHKLYIKNVSYLFQHVLYWITPLLCSFQIKYYYYYYYIF